MGQFISKTIVIEAVQYTGENWAEMRFFTGTRDLEPGQPVPVFNPIGTYLYNEGPDSTNAEFWMASISTHIVVSVNDWIVRDDNGLSAWKPARFEFNYEPVVDERPSELVDHARYELEMNGTPPELVP